MTDEDRAEIGNAMAAHFGMIWLAFIKLGVFDRAEFIAIMNEFAASPQPFGEIERHVARILARDPSPVPFTVLKGGKADE